TSAAHSPRPHILESGCLHRVLRSFPTRRSSDLRVDTPRVRPDPPGTARRLEPAHGGGEVGNPGRRLPGGADRPAPVRFGGHHHVDRKSTRLNSSHVKSSYAVFCLKKTNRSEDTR